MTINFHHAKELVALGKRNDLFDYIKDGVLSHSEMTRLSCQAAVLGRRDLVEVLLQKAETYLLPHYFSGMKVSTFFVACTENPSTENHIDLVSFLIPIVPLSEPEKNKIIQEIIDKNHVGVLEVLRSVMEDRHLLHGLFHAQHSAWHNQAWSVVYQNLSTDAVISFVKTLNTANKVQGLFPDEERKLLLLETRLKADQDRNALLETIKPSGQKPAKNRVSKI